MQRYSPTIHHYTTPDGSTVRSAMKEDSYAGDWYHRADVDKLEAALQLIQLQAANDVAPRDFSMRVIAGLARQALGLSVGEK